MSAILEYMLRPENNDICNIELILYQRKIGGLPQNVHLLIKRQSLLIIEHEEGEVLYTGGKKIEYKSEIERQLLTQIPQTDDDNRVRDWLRAIGYKEIEEIEKELEEIKRDAPQLIPIRYKRKVLKKEAIFKNPDLRKIYFSFSSLPIERIEVSSGGGLAFVDYDIGFRMSPSECKEIRDTFLDLCKEHGYHSPIHPKPTDNIDLSPIKKGSISTIMFTWFEDGPLRISLEVPATSEGIQILKGVEDKIRKFDPYTGNFSRNFERTEFP